MPSLPLGKAKIETLGSLPDNFGDQSVLPSVEKSFDWMLRRRSNILCLIRQTKSTATRFFKSSALQVSDFKEMRGASPKTSFKRGNLFKGFPEKIPTVRLVHSEQNRL